MGTDIQIEEQHIEKSWACLYGCATFQMRFCDMKKEVHSVKATHRDKKSAFKKTTQGFQFITNGGSDIEAEMVQSKPLKKH